MFHWWRAGIDSLTVRYINASFWSRRLCSKVSRLRLVSMVRQILDMDLLHGVARQLQQFAVTGKVSPTSGACYTCGGSGHRSRECATRNRTTATCYSCGVTRHYLFECSNRLRCISSRKRFVGKMSAFPTLQHVR